MVRKRDICEVVSLLGFWHLDQICYWIIRTSFLERYEIVTDAEFKSLKSVKESIGECNGYCF